MLTVAKAQHKRRRDSLSPEPSSFPDLDDSATDSSSQTSTFNQRKRKRSRGSFNVESSTRHSTSSAESLQQASTKSDSSISSSATSLDEATFDVEAYASEDEGNTDEIQQADYIIDDESEESDESCTSPQTFSKFHALVSSETNDLEYDERMDNLLEDVGPDCDITSQDVISPLESGLSLPSSIETTVHPFFDASIQRAAERARRQQEKEQETAKLEARSQLQEKKERILKHLEDYEIEMIQDFLDDIFTQARNSIPITACWFYAPWAADPSSARWKKKTKNIGKIFSFKGETLNLHVCTWSHIADGNLTADQMDGIIYGTPAPRSNAMQNEIVERRTLSHLCGNWPCLNPRHTVLEPNSINQARKSCHAGNNRCYHSPGCLINVQLPRMLLSRGIQIEAGQTKLTNTFRSSNASTGSSASNSQSLTCSQSSIATSDEVESSLSSTQESNNSPEAFSADLNDLAYAALKSFDE